LKDQIKQMRLLLDEMASLASSDEPSFAASFQLFELPELISNVVDYLQPILLPYEAAIYWYMFRHSIVARGDVFVRISVRRLSGERDLASPVITSSSGQSQKLSYGAVQGALTGLKDKGAVSLTGDTTREGTLYRVHLPEEIASCREKMSQMQIEQLPQVDPELEVDFYNIRENRQKVFERDKFLCHHCGKLLTRFSATLDHVQPVSEGGDHSYSNLVTSCLQCNSQRGAQPLMDFLTRKRDAHD